ncbi:unnamed protein product [Pleuronectes platessa]|uniref:Uncharacterized protein n=1 Tax=Pleuronectes platessa TaxID=8262 RepID=A0A9N7UN40_PLEPL|nr:unnamed protein product [Pleuronectes platessa]
MNLVVCTAEKECVDTFVLLGLWFRGVGSDGSAGHRPGRSLMRRLNLLSVEPASVHHRILLCIMSSVRCVLIGAPPEGRRCLSSRNYTGVAASPVSNTRSWNGGSGCAHLLRPFMALWESQLHRRFSLRPRHT